MRRRRVLMVAALTTVGFVAILAFVIYVPVLPATAYFPRGAVCFPTYCTRGYPNGFPVNYTVSISFRYFGYGAVSGSCDGYRVSSNFTISGYRGEGNSYCFFVGS